MTELSTEYVWRGSGECGDCKRQNDYFERLAVIGCGKGQNLDPRSMDHLFGPGPWTTYFSSLKKWKKKAHHVYRIVAVFTVKISIVTGQTRLPLVAKSIKKPLE